MGGMWRVVSTLVWFAVLVYFLAHGDDRLTANARLARKLAALDAEVAGLRAHKESLELRVARLRPETLDIDYLEERARVILNLAHPQELVIPPNLADPVLRTNVDARTDGGYVLVTLEE